jgi:hypothetical protein
VRRGATGAGFGAGDGGSTAERGVPAVFERGGGLGSGRAGAGLGDASRVAGGPGRAGGAAVAVTAGAPSAEGDGAPEATAAAAGAAARGGVDATAAAALAVLGVSTEPGGVAAAVGATLLVRVATGGKLLVSGREKVVSATAAAPVRINSAPTMIGTLRLRLNAAGSTSSSGMRATA